MKILKQVLKRLIITVICVVMIVTQMPIGTLTVRAEDTLEAIYHTGVVLTVNEAEDEVRYPWQAYEEAGETGYKSSNQGIHASISELYIKISSDKPVRVRFDYGVSSEAADITRFYCDDEMIWQLSNNYTGHYDQVFEPGSYQLKFEYIKDGSVNVGTDTAYVKNISIISACKDGEHVYSDYDCLCDACEGYTYHKHEYDNNKWDEQIISEHEHEGIKYKRLSLYKK